MALDLCSRAIVLSRGKVAADGPVREIFRNDALLASCRLERPLRLQGCPLCTPSPAGQACQGIDETATNA